MKTGINKTLLIATLITMPAWPLAAQSRHADPTERVVQDVIAFTLHRAAEEIMRVSHIDPVYRGYSRHYVVRHAPPRLDPHSRKQLHRLAADHKRKLQGYERELDRELDKLAREYQRDSHKRGQQHKAREKFQRKVDQAYDRFAFKTEREHDRFDHQRERILRNARA